MSSVLQKDPRIHPIYLGTIHTTTRELSIRPGKGVPAARIALFRGNVQTQSLAIIPPQTVKLTQHSAECTFGHKEHFSFKYLRKG